MALYSTSIETQVIDPVFSSKSRCEFRIPDRDGAYLPNLRLGNVGVTTTTNPIPYALGCGVASVIKRIQLMDGNEELDSLREANAWLTFKSFFRPNAEAASIKMDEEGGSGRGFTSGVTLEVDVPLPSQKFANTTNAGNEEIFTGYVDLRVIFPVLQQMSHLNTKMFPNLRVVIEWETDPSRILVRIGEGAVPTTPILMADVIMDDALIATLDKQMMAKPIIFDAIEVDRIGLASIGAIGDGTPKVQQVTLQSKGFLSKYVKRLCIQKSAQVPTLNVGTVGGVANTVRGFGGNGSLSMHKEQSNIRINGRNLLGGNGYITTAQTMMGVTDTWGEINSYPYSAIESVGLDNGAGTTAAANAPAGVPPTVPSILVAGETAKQSQLIGQQSYLGYRLEERCDNLQLNYQRTGQFQVAAAAPGTDIALNLTLYAEVSKQLTVRGMGDWSVSYM